ncbi:GNAT family N-acetyltransferase [Alkaliphilus pronyensis]|uniref:GNAT family N-acetyltransferase n=1 Tax=Alkaliphilus pronyensis TaxID=1482732 RepID=A0A6I0FA40_9FIRM|nr:GNAT family N-acetyltransferase [Alkaliphilus pronyensis]KAB3534168.1 GNAT family N-acetyltransferase [Alkaliphilus pronyensis]
MALIREYKPGDEAKILKLFNDIFKMDRSMEHWLWKFRDNPFNTSTIALAEEADEIIGQCTLLPSAMKIGEDNITGGQSIDAMIHKDYRRQGYYEKLSLYSYELGEKKSIKFRYSFPSPSTLEGILKKLGGTLVCKIPVYVKVINANGFVAIFIKNKTLAKLFSQPINTLLRIIKKSKLKTDYKYKINEVNDFDKGFNELWLSFKDRFKNLTVRDSQYLNWRICSHPDINYRVFKATDEKLMGYIVLKLEEKRVRGKYPMKVGTIVDLIALNSTATEELISKAVEFFQENKVDYGAAWGLEHMQQTPILKKAGFIKTKGSIPFAVKGFDNSLDELLYNKSNWYLMPIETDTY